MMRYLVFSMLLVLALPAAADEVLVGTPCESAADCPASFSCVAVPTGCDEADDCACPFCEPGQRCPPCECGEVEESCVPGTENRCVFAPEACAPGTGCTTPGFVCVEHEVCESVDCDCPGCPEGEPCDCDCGGEDVDETCTVAGAWCLPEEVPCATDADCANGWVCALTFEGGSGCEECVCTACDGPDCEEACTCTPCSEGVEASEGRCLPPGWEEQILADGGPANDGAPRGPMEAGGALGEGGGRATGCSAAGGGAASLLPLALLAAALRRRR